MSALAKRPTATIWPPPPPGALSPWRRRTRLGARPAGSKTIWPAATSVNQRHALVLTPNPPKKLGANSTAICAANLLACPSLVLLDPHGGQGPTWPTAAALPHAGKRRDDPTRPDFRAARYSALFGFRLRGGEPDQRKSPVAGPRGARARSRPAPAALGTRLPRELELAAEREPGQAARRRCRMGLPALLEALQANLPLSGGARWAARFRPSPARGSCWPANIRWRGRAAQLPRQQHRAPSGVAGESPDQAAVRFHRRLSPPRGRALLEGGGHPSGGALACRRKRPRRPLLRCARCPSARDLRRRSLAAGIAPAGAGSGCANARRALDDETALGLTPRDKLRSKQPASVNSDLQQGGVSLGRLVACARLSRRGGRGTR